MGATFAYFSVTGNSNATTTVTGTAEKPGIVSLESGKAYNGTLTAENMDDEALGSYYIQNDSSALVKDVNTGKSELTFATITATSSEAISKYHCTAKLDVTTSGTMTPDTLKTGEAFIKFNSVTEISAIDTEAVDLKNPYEQKSLEFDINGGSNIDITGNVYFVNKNENQNHLEGKDLTVSVKISELDCTVQAGE